MKFLLSALLIGTAAAFSPVSMISTSSRNIHSTSSSSLSAINELELGVTEPLGVFDPLGWLDTEPESFERRRAVERKHGRIAMIAIVGQIVHANGYVFDGYISKSQDLKFADIDPSCVGGKVLGGVGQIPTAGLAQILAFTALIELAWMPASNYAGDYGVGWFGADIKDENMKAQKLNVELNNGRAAMLAVIGNMVGEAATGQTLAESWASGFQS
jgi:light-harvesting complex I chlorophyll a/b binding protein 1